MRVAIIGGGIAGLAAAYELEKARAAGAPVSYTLYESQPRLGGTLASEIADGAVLERGPDSFITEKTAAADLCRELGLKEELIPSNDAARRTWIVVRNRLVPLPDGLMFLVPTRLIPTAATRLFSLRTKLRMALELLHPPRPVAGDESVAALVERHYGAEAVDRLADPLLSGIYGGDAAQLSAQTVLPRLVEMERKYGSLTRGMLAAHRAMRERAKAAVSSKARERGAPIFTTLRGGMQQLADALVTRLDPESIRRGTPVNALERAGERWVVKSERDAHAMGGEGDAVFDAVILATPAWAAGALLRTVDRKLGEELSAIPYSSSITVNLVYGETQIGALPEGFGFLVPGSEGRALLACTFAHRKFLGRTPPGKAVLRAFLGGARNEGLLAESDAALIQIVRRELSEILGAKVLGREVEPEHAQVSRWRRAMAQYAVGHKQRVERIRTRVAAMPGLRLAGNAYDGIGIPDCIRLGRQAARELAASGADQRANAR
ncbi:MAG TPA: protoporphyrinogen oxidase [Terracidiphilus sp.]|nr:protoporphyrinogen oxidase [Terracidiphilus sp.]